MEDQLFVEVVGVGAAHVHCDLVRLHVGAQASAESVADAFAEAEAALSRMVDALRRNGAEDLQSSEIDLHPDYDSRGPAGRFRASMGVHLTLRDVASAGSVLAAAVEAGGDASRVHGLRLSSSSTDEALVTSRQAAWDDARTKAEQYAALAGLRLGAVQSVTELGGDPRPFMVTATAASLSSTVEAGSQTVHASVTVRWSLLDRP